MKHYSTKNRILTALAVLIVLGDLILAGMVWKQEEDKRLEAWANSYPMANQHIEWTGGVRND